MAWVTFPVLTLHPKMEIAQVQKAMPLCTCCGDVSQLVEKRGKREVNSKLTNKKCSSPFLLYAASIFARDIQISRRSPVRRWAASAGFPSREC